jgi:hypothetical protein
MGYIVSTVGLRPATCIAWVRNWPGTGGLLRTSWDPVLVVARGVPDAVDRAAIRNVVTADYPARRTHRTGNPPPSTNTSSPASVGLATSSSTRAGEAISTAFTESAVNQVISKRLVKKQQMRWTPRGAHLLLQVRIRVLNDQLAGDFHRWYPASTRRRTPWCSRRSLPQFVPHRPTDVAALSSGGAAGLL